MSHLLSCTTVLHEEPRIRRRAQAAHAPGAARRGAAAARRAELRQPQPARGQARRPGIVPTAFYRHFDEHGGARPGAGRRVVPDAARDDPRGARGPTDLRARDPQLGRDPRAPRARAPHCTSASSHASASAAWPRCARRSAARSGLFSSELATDLARFPYLDRWSTEDLQLLAGLMVNAMVSTAEAILDAPPKDPDCGGRDHRDRGAAAAHDHAGRPRVAQPRLSPQPGRAPPTRRAADHHQVQDPQNPAKPRVRVRAFAASLYRVARASAVRKTPGKLAGLAERIATGFGDRTFGAHVDPVVAASTQGPITFFDRTKLSSVVPPGDGEPESVAGA